MFQTTLGIILLLTPFLLINKFEQKKYGPFYILSFLLGLQLLIATTTQFLGIFNYKTILSINLIIAAIVIYKTNLKETIENIKEIKIDWMLVLIILILSIQFYSIHYNYTGTITTISESYKEVKNLKYPYPYFSDEWSAISLIKYSIDSGNLPLVNPLTPNKDTFPNFELPFHSFISNIIILLNLNPLTNYTLLTIFTSLLICILVYSILRVNYINKTTAAITTLSIPYITNGANLPGLWTLIPITLGITSLLLTFYFMSINDKKMILYLSFITLIFYPPLFIFLGPSIIFYFSSRKIKNRKKIKYLTTFLVICIISAIIIAVFAINTKSSLVELIIGNIIYETFTKNAIPSYKIYNVIPIFSIALAIIAIPRTISSKKWIITPIITGLLFWTIYSKSLSRFIMGYERVILTTSIIIIILSGFGLNNLINYLKPKEEIKKYKIIEIASIVILLLFLILSFSYTDNNNWKKLTLHSTTDNRIFNPAAPANTYLHKDDLALFHNIEDKRFIAPLWKGTVIGVATNNYPTSTKPSTITVKGLDYKKFISSTCERKTYIASINKIDYAYSEKFDCKRFQEIGNSEEGLYLYKYLEKDEV